MFDEKVSDGELIAGCREVAHAAFETLAYRHLPAMHRTARWVTGGDDALAADAVQDALLAVFRGVATYDETSGAVRPWLMAITRHAAHRALRQRRLVPVEARELSLLQLGGEAGWGDDDPERHLGHLEDVDALARAMALLQPEEREVIELRDVEGLSGQDAARALGLELSAMKSRLHRARLSLMALVRRRAGGVMAEDRLVGSLRCSEVLARLSEYIDGELGAESVAAIHEHVGGCTVCERFGGRFSSAVATMRRTLGAPVSVDEALVARLRQRLLG